MTTPAPNYILALVTFARTNAEIMALIGVETHGQSLPARLTGNVPPPTALVIQDNGGIGVGLTNREDPWVSVVFRAYAPDEMTARQIVLTARREFNRIFRYVDPNGCMIYGCAVNPPRTTREANTWPVSMAMGAVHTNDNAAS